MDRPVKLTRPRANHGPALAVAIAATLVGCSSSDRSSDYDTLDVTVSIERDAQGRRYAVARADVGRLTDGDRVAVRYAGDARPLYRRQADYRYTARLPDIDEPDRRVTFDVTRGSGGDTVSLTVPLPDIEDFTVTRSEPGIDASHPVELSWRLVPTDDRLQTLVEARPLRCEDASGIALPADRIQVYGLSSEFIGERLVVVPAELLPSPPPAGTLCRYAVSLGVRTDASTSGAPRDDGFGDSVDTINVRSGFQALRFEPIELDVRFGGQGGAT